MTPLTPLTPLAAVLFAASLGYSRLSANGVQVNPAEFDKCLQALVKLARTLEPQVVAVAPPDNSADHGTMNAAAVAARLDVTKAAVTKAAREGRLAGTLDPDGWSFTRQAVDKWKASR